ncbi:hypothetical protein AALP_AA7G018700 [Arabis alpina]|uniref:TIR domain-containing protein n=1 Tax=Arabis alpina TaxID=50452 RepID=A0A087GFE9_ARAAL|nr:hypothetical protein AALP_AA7G018700 [Arabis alpina]
MVDGNALYMSFNRCEDTIRYSFLSHLFADFRGRSISVKNPASDHNRVSEELEAAITQSKVILVILSEQYVSSKWCLDELVKILGSNGPVVPVFYGLTKSALRKQCLKLKKTYPKDRVADWRRALLEIADLPGHASSLDRSDSELVEEIVANVRQKLDRTSKIGVYSRLKKIENLLCKQPWGIRSLGIWGMGGIGKTTLANAAFEQLLSGTDFEASCFIKDFDNAFQEKGVYGLLEEHLGKKLGLSGHVTRESLRDKRILLVLNDVDKLHGATTFLRSFGLLGSGSLIIITSRDKQLLVQCRVNEIYEVQGLNDDEALQLFSRCAFGKEVTDQNLLRLSMDLVDYANGNPLALSIYGRELKGKAPSEMESAVRKIKQHLSDEIFDTFKRSYDALSDHEKEIFLVIVFSFRGEIVDNLMQFLSSCGFFPRVGIDVLADKGLVVILENRVQIHNLVYDVGLKIIKEQPEEIGMSYRFLEASNIQSLLEENEIEDSGESVLLENEDIKAIIMDTSNLGHIAFQHMYGLRYLKICNSNHMKNLDFPFSEHHQSLPPELRLLHWENYPSLSFPQDFDVQYLVELNMPHSKLQKLWGTTKNLEVLKRITLSHSLQLVNVDELKYSRNIEKIDLQGCSRLQSFPDTDQLQHLQIVDLSTCLEIKKLPKVPSSIRKLYLEGTGIKELSLWNHSPQSEGLSNALGNEHTHREESASQVNVSIFNQDLGKLVSLNLKDCSHLTSLPDMVTFEALEDLDVSGCSKLEKIHVFPQNMKKLFMAKTAVKEISSSLYHDHSVLTILDMKDCKSFRNVPEGMSNMKSLASLNLSGCSRLESIQDLPRNLKELYLADTAVKEFPSPLLDSLSKLVILSLGNCKNLQNLPMQRSNLISLVTLTLSGCSALEEIPDFPQNLKELYLVGIAITELPSSILDLAELATLDLHNCKRLKNLPVGMENLNPLEFLDLSGCSELQVSISSLPEAKKIRLDNMGTSAPTAKDEEESKNTERKYTKRFFVRSMKRFMTLF